MVAGLCFLCFGAAAGQSPAPPQTSLYLQGEAISYEALLPAPPAAGSAAQRRDMAAVHAAEAHRTARQVRQAQFDDQNESIFAFTGVLDPALAAANLPLTAALSAHVRHESAVVNPGLKIAFDRKRPFVADPTLHPVCALASTNSYPSGHAMVGYLEAFTLATMFPEHKDAILLRARDFANNRVVCGVHYPTDVEASRTVALALFGALETSPAFRTEVSAAAAEMKGALHPSR